jgi:hypothetical protein
MLAQTTKLKIGSSIASIYARDAFTSRRGMITLNDLFDNRFILGLGVSHPPMVEGLRGHTYEKPIPAMRRYLNGITKDQPGAAEWPLCVAALGPLMMKLSGEMTHGGSGENPRPQQVAGDRAEGHHRNRPGEGPRAGPEGVGAVHDARQLPQQLPPHRLHREGPGERRVRRLHRPDVPLGFG